MSKKQMNPALKNFRFKKHANIGAPDAIEDRSFLDSCFIDTGDLDILRDNARPECIIMGRTGSGKTALLEKLYSTEERTIKLAPESLALTYISNNDILRFFIEAGVKMDLFYRLLWRHIFTVEIIKARYQITNEQKRDDFIASIRKLLFPNKAKQEAVEYLVEWGKSFWKETDYRVKEITTTLVDDLKKSINLSTNTNLSSIFSGAGQFSADKVKTLTEEQKAEIVRYGQPIVNQIQIKKLSDIINLLDGDILKDKQKRYYITIDKLDENWVDDTLRYQLIRALMETIRDFNKISTVKIIIAVREDLIDRVFRFTRDPGYQEEKYSSMYLNLHWKAEDLIKLLNTRVNELIRRQYTNQPIDIKEILPSKINAGTEKVSPLDYILERTMLRPRDAISFFNECVKAAEGKAMIGQENMQEAEAIYSEKRFRALGDEWAADYPTLLDLSLMLKKYPRSIKYQEISRDKIQFFIAGFLEDFKGKQDEIYLLIDRNSDYSKLEQLIKDLFKILYRVGIIGIKPDSSHSVFWSYQGQKLPEISQESTIHIHPAFWRTLGIS